MLTKGCAPVNVRDEAVESAEWNSLYRPGACAKISYRETLISGKLERVEGE
jgi:hypothetical protein